MGPVGPVSLLFAFLELRCANTSSSGSPPEALPSFKTYGYDTEKIKILQEADYIYINELISHKLYHKIWQAYAALLPMKTVGVMGDSRTYEYTCLLRAVTSEDGMSADYFNFPKEFLDKISNKIINGVPGINRVVYDITSKPPSTIELE